MLGAVISVGGSPQPIVKALTWFPVQRVLFVVSAQSASQVTSEILPKLDQVPQFDLICVPNPNHLEQCYLSCRQGILEWLEKWKLDPNDVYFDFTGGTKPMSAGLAMAASEFIPRYHYVSGDRDKGDLGVVITGTESSVGGLNPLAALAVKHRQLATEFFRQGYVDQAAALLDEAARTASVHRQTLQAFSGLCRVLARLDRLDFRNLAQDFARWEPQLRIIFEQKQDTQALQWLSGLRAYLQALEGEVNEANTHRLSLRELLASARRRARQGLYDEAVARLYRAVELHIQDQLHVAFGAHLGKIRKEDVSPDLWDQLLARFPDCVDEKGRLRLSLGAGCKALELSPLPEHQRASALWHNLAPVLELRNQSWLAHGTRPVDRSDFEQMWHAVLSNLELEEREIPEWPSLSFV